jgi:CubicO group peptidase (beta-lactamase class C family)
MKNKIHHRAGLLLFLMTLPCLTAQAQDRYQYRPPAKLDDGWEVSSLKAEGLDEDLIVSMTQRVLDGNFKGIHSLAVVRNGKLVHEAYLDDYSAESLQRIHSITKSISSLLIGIAIDKGLITSVEEPVMNFFPDQKKDFEDPRKRAVKLRHILTLTTGLDWSERQYPYSDPRNNEYHMVRSDNWIEYVLSLPMRDEPGERWEYNTGSVHLLSGIIRQVSGLTADRFAEKYLFGPLGITHFEWNKDPQGNPCTGGTHGGLRMRTRDVAKIGALVLGGGMWKGRRVVSEEWLETSTRRYVDPPDFNAMGYLWWHQGFTIRGTRIKSLYGAGYGGQSLTTFPDYDLILVLTCWTQANDAMIFGPILMTINSALKNSGGEE